MEAEQLIEEAIQLAKEALQDIGGVSGQGREREDQENDEHKEDINEDKDGASKPKKKKMITEKEIPSREKAELTSKAEVFQLQKQLQDAQEEARMKREEARDLNIKVTSYEKQLKNVKNKLKIKTEDHNQLETQVVQIKAELDNVSKELETAIVEKNIQREKVDWQIRANMQSNSNILRELEKTRQTVSSQEKQLTENKEAINGYSTEIKDLKSSLFNKTHLLDAELEKNKRLEVNVQCLVHEMNSLRDKTVEMEKEKEKIKLDLQAKMNENKETFDKERAYLKQKISEAEEQLNSHLCKSIKELQQSMDEKTRENDDLRNKLKAIETIAEKLEELHSVTG